MTRLLLQQFEFVNWFYFGDSILLLVDIRLYKKYRWNLNKCFKMVWYIYLNCIVDVIMGFLNSGEQLEA